ncbi:hypothetical protein BX600DRAFT_319503 [Xylariales sp. PMI_506]|nr:hypothetical protein BX600DRAFT_319503 [Xylariales sp. PMI_506]
MTHVKPAMPEQAPKSTRTERRVALSAALLALPYVVHALRFIPARMLHISMLIVCCMAFAGPGAEDSTSYVVVQDSIKFPTVGRSVQQAEIALTVLWAVFDPILSILFMWWSSRVTNNSIHANPSRVRRLVMFFLVPVNIIALAGWIICIVYQSSYVPILGGKVLKLCNSGHKVTQCNMVTASWIIAMFYCLDHILLIIMGIISIFSLP